MIDPYFRGLRSNDCDAAAWGATDPREYPADAPQVKRPRRRAHAGARMPLSRSAARITDTAGPHCANLAATADLTGLGQAGRSATNRVRPNLSVRSSSKGGIRPTL